ncbi:hypothetical protein [Halobacteriovorax sp. HLS]|uniref:hypothetical protein n=1 Tax=Halobacteriovorax sp. HLS TaxID=2234000 RepID=UPI000FD73510|nr:hypothetical protein [Halobacteriovorax sp. HLS]
MSYSDLKKLKKEEVKTTNRIDTTSLVVGGDVFALATLEALLKTHAKEDILLLTKENISQDGVGINGPGSLRGQSNIDYMEKFYSYADIEVTQKKSTYYKDLKFKAFGSRGKHEKLLWGEEFFTNPRARYSSEKIFTFMNDENFFEDVSKVKLEHIPNKIFKEDNLWVVECTNGTQIYCKNLYWCESPWKFYQDFPKKESLSNEFVQFVEGTQTPCALHIKLIFEKELTNRQETMLIPLSYTHEWGHFIGEFKNVCEENKTQEANFLAYIDVNHTNEEDISKKIRLLKRNLEKIFPAFKGISFKEFIVLTENTDSLNFDDSYSLSTEKALENVYFVSSNAPFIDSAQNENNFGDSVYALSHMARGLKVLSEIKLILSKEK